MIRVLVADDEPHVLSALADVIAHQAGMRMVAAVADAEQAVAESAVHRPDVALVDVRMPGGGGIAAVRGIAEASPGTKTLALSSERHRDVVLRMLEAGSVGYLTKGCAIETILESIVRAAFGEASLSADVTAGVIETAVGTTRAERDRFDEKLNRIRRVLDEGFEIVVQAIYDLSSREPVGYEALSRFPEGAPAAWFTDAAEVGLGAELELAAISTAVRLLPALVTGFLSLNVSPAVVAKPGFLEAVQGAPLERIVIEITEHAPIADYDRLSRTLEAVRGRGLRVAVDDAGAGFASLRHILRLTPDLIKLDGSLVGGIDTDRSQQALARGLTSFARGIDATLVAEGIERPEELGVLGELGIEYGQGFYLGPPATVS